MFQHYLAFSDKPVLKRYNMDITFISGGMIHEQLSMTEGQIASYSRHLRLDEKSPGTVQKYLRDIRAFVMWLDHRPANKELSASWKSCLLEQGYAPVTINSMLSALNGLFKFLGWNEC